MIDWVQPRHFFGKLSARLAAPARQGIARLLCARFFADYYPED
jgi:hypothetical protein